ncbi:MAG TPA: PRC-barrel domain-containing protein [Verrucomicrobiae bacterium]
MKKQSKLNSFLAAATLCAAVTAASTVAIAQEASTDPPQQQQQGQAQQDQQQQALQQERQQSGQPSSASTQPQIVTKCSEMIGAKVENQRGQTLGHISDVVVSYDKSRVSYCVLDVKTRMFTKAKLLAVPMAAFHPSDDGSYLILNASRENLAKAEGFNPNDWPATGNAAWGAQPETTQQLPPSVVFAPAVIQPPVEAPRLAARPSYPWNPDPAFPAPTGVQSARLAADSLYFQVQFGPIAMPH